MGNSAIKRSVLKSSDFIRAVILFVAGIAIAVTGVQHRELSFDINLFAGTLLAVVAGYVIAIFLDREQFTARLAVLGLLNFVTSSIAFAPSETSSAFAVSIAIWAGLSALAIVLLRGGIGALAARDRYLQAGLHVLLAVVVLLTRDDQIMVIGLFGAFAILLAVFAGIASIDSSGAQSSKLVADNPVAE